MTEKKERNEKFKKVFKIKPQKVKKIVGVKTRSKRKSKEG